MRRLITFACDGDSLVGTIDDAAGGTGLLIVSGGNEIRVGAHRGQARLAQDVAAAGHPVFRYDRRGVGDSEGVNGGFEGGRLDLIAAVAAFRREAPAVSRIVALGNCDAASTLALWGAQAGVDALVLANPWVIETHDAMPPPAAIRARYAERLRDLNEWKRLLTGGVDLRKLAHGMSRLVRKPRPATLPARIAAGMHAFSGPMTLLLAERDNTAIAFREAWRDRAFAPVSGRTREHHLDSASHSFAGTDHGWLRDRVLDALRE